MNLLTLGGGALLALGLLASCHHPKPNAAAARAIAVTAHQQDHLARAVTAIAKTAQTRAAHVAATSEEAAHGVETATGADAPVPDDVLDGWGDAVDRLRDDAARAHRGTTAAAGDDARSAAPAVPAPQPPG